MDNESVMKILSTVGAVITGSHIVYTSGRHGTAYINKDALYLHPQSTAILCKEIASHYNSATVDVVAGPTIGGVILSQWVAYHMNLARTVGETLSIYAEEEMEEGERRRIFKRGYDACIPGKNIVVVEDILTTGGSARKVIEAVKALGGVVLGLSVLCNRGGIKPDDVCGVPINALTNVTLDSWDSDSCPLCHQNIPINTTVGKGKDFLNKKTAGIKFQH